MWLRFFAAAALGLIFAGPCQADCASFSASSINLVYDPLGGAATLGLFEGFPITVTRGVATGGVVTGVTGQFMDQGQTGAVFRLDGGPTYDLTDQNNNEVIVHQSSSPLMVGHTFFADFSSPADEAHAVAVHQISGLAISVPPGQDVAAGVYASTLDVQFECAVGDTAGDVRMQTGVLPVTITVPSVLSVNLAGGGLKGTIDFDQFEDLTKSANIQVRSTGPFILHISAEHAGKMVLLGTTGGAGQEVPYTLNFNGAPTPLDSDIGYQRTGVGGLSMPLAVTVGDTSGDRAGDYKDTLTLVFTPRATL
ncbi:MAG TPA: hypothetical protein VHW60_20595 [Caulobacteraceae bacterium]|jgi:hypothetical protein|nr:hypothetical protein [Caulobacteraceae bacterium]